MTGRVERGLEAHRYVPGKYGGRACPMGPLGTHEVGPPAAIGFCPLCATNARQTTGVRGVYDCPTCTFYWYDDRVGEQMREFEDFFSSESDYS